jgi:hypothetical protein
MADFASFTYVEPSHGLSFTAEDAEKEERDRRIGVKPTAETTACLGLFPAVSCNLESPALLLSSASSATPAVKSD